MTSHFGLPPPHLLSHSVTKMQTLSPLRAWRHLCMFPCITGQQKQVFLPLKWSRKASSKNRLKNTMTIYTFNNKITYLFSGRQCQIQFSCESLFWGRIKTGSFETVIFEAKNKKVCNPLAVYFDQILGAARTWKLIEMIFRLCTSLHLFFIFFVIFVWSNTQ